MYSSSWIGATWLAIIALFVSYIVRRHYIGNIKFLEKEIDEIQSQNDALESARALAEQLTYRMPEVLTVILDKNRIRFFRHAVSGQASLVPVVAPVEINIEPDRINLNVAGLNPEHIEYETAIFDYNQTAEDIVNKIRYGVISNFVSGRGEQEDKKET